MGLQSPVALTALAFVTRASARSFGVVHQFCPCSEIIVSSLWHLSHNRIQQ